jgi:formate dehydrogenase subunit gamma
MSRCENIPTRVDIEWLTRGGGIIGDDHPPAYRFNAGQKFIYWASCWAPAPR